MMPLLHMRKGGILLIRILPAQEAFPCLEGWCSDDLSGRHSLNLWSASLTSIDLVLLLPSPPPFHPSDRLGPSSGSRRVPSMQHS